MPKLGLNLEFFVVSFGSFLPVLVFSMAVFIFISRADK